MATALLVLISVVCAMPAVLDAQTGASETGQSAHRVIQNLRYDTGPTSDPVAHTLDLYLPEGRSNTPVLFFVRGATGDGGDTSSEGLVNLVELFLSRGIAVASINYRDSLAVQHPVPVQDVARAFAWVHRNASRYSLDTSNLFVAGHSDGGHLVALLGTEAGFLEAEGLSLKAIRGVIASSGIYDLLNHRGPGVDRTTWGQRFGEDREALKDASPAWKIEQASPDTPPFLITYADDDRFGFGEQAKSFYGLLLDSRLPAHLVEVSARTHVNTLSLLGRTVVNDASDNAVIQVQDLLGPAMVWFVNGVQDGSLARSFYAVWPVGGPGGVPELPGPAMKVIPDIQYYDGPDADPQLHSLDLYLPEGETNVPLLFQVHGGRWRVGDKGNPETVVNLVGRLGWGVVSTNYRLSPAVKHPAHVQDVARAFAWVYTHAAEYGIDRERIVITGQSAGGASGGTPGSGPEISRGGGRSFGGHPRRCAYLRHLRSAQLARARTRADRRGARFWYRRDGPARGFSPQSCQPWCATVSHHVYRPRSSSHARTGTCVLQCLCPGRFTGPTRADSRAVSLLSPGLPERSRAAPDQSGQRRSGSGARALSLASHPGHR